MQLAKYWTILRRRKWVVALVALVTVVLAAVGTSRATPIYQSTATLYVATSVDGQYSSGQTTYADRLKRTYSVLATSHRFLVDVQDVLGLDKLPDVDVAVLANTELMEVRVSHADPRQATEIANTVAVMIVAESERTLQGQANPVKLRHEALEPRNPSGPRQNLNLALGGVVGLLGGLGLALLWENLDSTLHTPEQIREATDLLVMGEIPRAGRILEIRRSLFASTPEGDAFLRLQSNLLGAKARTRLQSLTVTGALPAEGKSTVAAGLAFVLAMSGRNVIIVDGDLRRPSLHEIFKVPNLIGLHDVIADDVRLDEATQVVVESPNLTVLTSGRPTSQPFELFGADGMKDLFKELEANFDFVIFDSPPLSTVPDAALLAPRTDGVLLVVRQGRTKRDAFKSAEQQLTIARANIVGVVINRTKRPKRRAMSAYYDNPL